ncbi:MAG: murein hydrolase activator EnvC family protein [Ilumatobacteraceae bacterium]
MSRSLLVLVAGLLALGSPSDSVSCLVAPVTAPVSEPFEAPTCPYCAGHRGVEYSTSPGEPVTAASEGVVTFAGQVAGVRWVVVADLPGRLVSYGYLRTSVVAVGEQVAVGEVLGTSSERLYLGVRQDDAPVDPAPLLAGTVAVSRPRLVPSDGSPGRPAPVVATTCVSSPEGR